MTRIYEKVVKLTDQPRNGATEVQYAQWLEIQRKEARKELPLLMGMTALALAFVSYLMYLLLIYIAGA